MSAITGFDLSVLHFVENNLQNPFLTFFFRIFSLASEWGLIWIALAVALLISKKYRKGGAMLALSLIFCFIITNLILKNAFMRPRPYALDTFSLLIPKPGEWSFPSGHAAISFCGAFSLAKINRKWTVPAYSVAVLTALSRIYFTVHYPTDVLGGIIAGTAAAALALLVFRAADKKITNRKNGFYTAKKK